MLELNKFLILFVFFVVCSRLSFGGIKINEDKTIYNVILKKGSYVYFNPKVEKTENISAFIGDALINIGGSQFNVSEGAFCYKGTRKISTFKLSEDKSFKKAKLKKGCYVSVPCVDKYFVLCCNNDIEINGDVWYSSLVPEGSSDLCVVLDEKFSPISGVMKSSKKPLSKKILNKFWISKYNKGFFNSDISKFDFQNVVVKNNPKKLIDYSSTDIETKTEVTLIGEKWAAGTQFAFDENGYVNKVSAVKFEVYKKKLYDDGFYLELERSDTGNIISEKIITSDMEEYDMWSL